MADRDGDPNFPTGGLSIGPSHVHYHISTNKDDSHEWQQDQQVDIEKWGIAGRVWEAAYLLTRYLSHDSDLVFDPPCSIFDGTKTHGHTILELGAGVGVVGIHLALELSKARASLQQNVEQPMKDIVVLTDLENVLDLLERNVKRANLVQKGDISVFVRALPWGSNTHANKIQQELSPRNPTHIICSDLVYFPELLCPLLRSIIYLTQSTTNAVEVIVGYKIRSHSKEETFWKAFGIWFDFYPVLCKNKKKKMKKETFSMNDLEWRRFGRLSSDSGRNTVNCNEETASEDELFVFVAKRKQSTLDCQMPEDDQQLLGGWLLKEDSLQRGTGAETFELVLMNAIQE